MKLIITVDTEADDQWKSDSSDTIHNVSALPRFQALCEKYDMFPTYLVTYEVVADNKAAAMLKDWQNRGVAEVGAHLHPWTTPPFFENEKGKSFPNELSDESLRAKFIALTDSITERIGKPKSYRAGRWGFDERQATLLAELGYRVDCSITPAVSWRSKSGLEGGVGGPDFTTEIAEPHMLNERVLEVPMTILPVGLLGRLRWFRIFEDTTLAQLCSVVRSARRKNLPALMFMIHSSELVPGQSPYVKDLAALEHVYATFESLLAFCKKERVTGLTLADFTAQYRAVQNT